MKNIQFLLIPLLLVIFSFKSSVEVKEPSIIGIWIMEEASLTDRTYKRVNQFFIQKGGMQFLEDGTFINRINAGRCGTPPISYTNAEGKWETLANGNIKITYSNWRGPTSRIFKVKMVKKKQMVLSFLR